MLLILYAQLVLVTVVLLPWSGFSLHVPLFTLVAMLALVSHCRAQFTDPGAVPRDHLPPTQPVVLCVRPNGSQVFAEPPRVCRKCRTLKPWKAHRQSLRCCD